MGITTMADLARKVEMAAKQNMADEATILSDQLAAQYAEVKPALAQILTEITT
jgi:hypothetical protein